MLARDRRRRTPGNLGTIVRTARRAARPESFSSARNAIHSRPTFYGRAWAEFFISASSAPHTTSCSAGPAAGQCKSSGSHHDAERLWTELRISAPVAIVLGEERRGLSDRLRGLCHSTVRLPMTGHADSLNVGVAAGVMMYELVRRRMAGR